MSPAGQLRCPSCGANLALPEDLSALELTCQYCGSAQLLPKRIVKQRRQQQHRAAAELEQVSEPTSASEYELTPEPASIGLGAAALMFLVFAGLMVGLILGIVHLVESHLEAEREASSNDSNDSNDSNESVGGSVGGAGTPAAPPTPAPPPEPPPLPEETEHNNGLALVRQRMVELHEAGCDRVLTPPTRFDSSATFSLTMSKSSRHCVVLVAATAMPDTQVTLEAKDPLATAIETPDPAPSFEWRFCPSVDGEHALALGRQGRGPFHVGVYDCPKRKFEVLPTTGD